MTVTEALSRWTQACDGIELKGQIVRNGNWHPLARALRHFTDENAALTVAEQGGTAILKVTPAEREPPAGKSAMKRPAFHLIVQ